MYFEELTGSPKMTLTAHNGHSMTRTFLVAWEDSATFATAVFAGGFPGYPTSYPQQVALEPFLGENDIASGQVVDPSLTTAQYRWAKATVSYATTQWGASWPADIPVPSHDSVLAVPARATNWEDVTPGDEDKPVPPEDQMNRILIPLIDYNVNWDWVANPPRDKLRGFLGKTNSDTFMGCEAETLLCEGAHISPSFRPATDPRCYAVDVVLKQRRIVDPDDADTVYGWNHEYREDPAGWTKIKLSDKSLRYSTVDFDDLFEQ